jgi:hypothetical protein
VKGFIMSSKTKQLNEVRGRLVGLSSVVLAVLFMQSVASNVFDELNTGAVNAPNSYAAIFALVAVAISVWWEGRLRLLTSLTLGLLTASYFIWQFGLH